MSNSENIPNSENISLWKKKSEIDYIPLFISLWLSLNAWLKDKRADTTNKDEDFRGRKLINHFKESEDIQLAIKFSELLHYGNDEKSIIFKGHFLELHQALESANIKFHGDLPGRLKNAPNQKVSFTNTVLDWNNNPPSLESIIKENHQDDQQEDTFRVSENFYIDNNSALVFRAYIENLYQIRCSLFHGDLSLNKENERVIRAFYLTLSMIMEGV